MNEAFQADYYRMTGTHWSFLPGLKNFLFMHNIRYMYWWRRRNAAPHCLLAKWMCFRMGKKYGLELGNCRMGTGIYLGHAYNITVNSDAVIGSNVNLHKGVTIGMENRGKRKGCPEIGDNVYIGVHATLVGGIRIGSDVLIAPNAFVNFDVPDHSVVIGNPGVIHPKESATQGYSGISGNLNRRMGMAERKQYPGLDLCKLMAAVMVVLIHSIGYLLAGRELFAKRRTAVAVLVAACLGRYLERSLLQTGGVMQLLQAVALFELGRKLTLPKLKREVAVTMRELSTAVYCVHVLFLLPFDLGLQKPWYLNFLLAISVSVAVYAVVKWRNIPWLCGVFNIRAKGKEREA